MGSKRTALDGAVGTQASVPKRRLAGIARVAWMLVISTGSELVLESLTQKNLSDRKVDRDFWGQ